MNTPNSLTVVVIQLVFLLVLWLLIFVTIAAMRRDLVFGRKVRTAGPPSSASAQSSSQPEGVPRAMQLVITEGPLKGFRRELEKEKPLTLGRAQDNAIVLEDDYASGRHVRLFPQGSQWFIEDLGSTNGTYVRDQLLTRAIALEPGSPVRIGKSVLELRP